ncbi:phosphoglycolate phosphatase-like HAD superfamily hydrolase [Allocatelliglobosispora scoriae]|uniref:Phosphoglycolate phosphatase-like HAD superfamily hydrolase n=1 Tax=Allocatelliglobosispora scoriae TaxID=643052 RepID=A0A841BUS9_9ACTN|nr:haloacid dehalogenase-like hydrolase [Allocatelliglobosispora scoriae]MBB5871208.1 phosphoglycolate phosphatase-like HAD superfamily hydrolase [Allocatelliglobosispora scoriae]
MAETPLLVLWDVDGTLISNGGVSKEAYALAFRMLTGRTSTEKVITDGMTDIAIMRSLFDRHGLEISRDQYERLFKVMPRALDSLVVQLRNRGKAMPGARHATHALAHEHNVIQSVLSGNVAANAFTKLATFGLHGFLDFEIGGYGSDSEQRNDLVEIARSKALEKYNIVFDSFTTVIVGDTPRDVEAGKVGGAYVVAVASGEYDVDDLTTLGADVVLPDLKDTPRLVEAVLSARRAR